MKNVSFDLKIGESIGVVGESGSGKTSLILAILNLIKSTGKIKINEKDLDQLNKKEMLDLRKEIQIVFQDPFSSLSPRMNIEDIIAEGLLIHYPNINKKEKEEKIKNILEKVGLEYKETIEKFLYGLAKSTLAERTQQLANRHCFTPNRISIRNQKTRWGSCSNSKTISLNWRLIQVPAFVRDYVILHELVHLEYLDHSPSFWTRLNQLCHNLQAAELWLNDYSQQV